ncbi:sensor domain-containing diguanylate cyclase [Aliamphritea ceti]|uniref:sensor domain-containing diguanylate cyclase n=1 Tax=Aliamphritea ceti TaxID=1524258 RepID=UPI0021C2D199|nr:diguanylate cyclase [Aliamphritea ceti]
MKIQHKIIAIPLAVMLFVSLVTILFLEHTLRKDLRDRKVAELTTLAVASLESLKTLEALDEHEDEQISRSFQRLATNFSHAGDIRVTYIDANGRVLGDSEVTYDKLSHLENHLDRAEILQALEAGKGVSESYSDTLSLNMVYVAVRSDEDHFTDENSHLAHPIIARIARSELSIQAAINEFRETLIVTGLISLLAVLGLGYFGSRAMNKAVMSEQSLLEQRVNDRTTEISILQTFGALLNACSTLAEAGEVMKNVIPRLIPGCAGSISIIKASRNRLDAITSWGGEWPGAERFAPSECWSLRKGHQHLALEHGIQTYCQHWAESLEGNQTLCLPLIAQGETVGILHFVLPDGEGFDQSQGLMNSIAEQAGLTLANIQLRDTLREQAIRDPLTGLYNRRYMLEALDQAHSRVERTNTEIAVLMVDLDHFKRFNDNFGHDAGDHVLKAFSQILKESSRNEDIACRYGGEEFCIVCPSTNETQALKVATRIIKGISKQELTMNQLSLGKVTTSIGIAVYPGHASSMDEVVKLADEALYIAKQNGRDRVEVIQLSGVDTSVSDEIEKLECS